MAKDPYRYFRVEAAEIVEQLNRGVLELEKNPTPQLMSALLRHAHTLKGAARVVKLKEVADCAHQLEDHLEPFRNTPQHVDSETITMVLALLDEVGSRLAALGKPSLPKAEAAPRVEEETVSVRAELSEIDAVLEETGEAFSRLAELRGSQAELEQAAQLAEWLQPQVSGAAARGLLHELREKLAQLKRRLGSGLEGLERDLGQLRDGTERLRLVPVASLFTTLERTARDAAGQLGRAVQFQGKGGEVRLDAHVLRQAQAAMVQAVRNAVAHGIEPEAERLAAGKPAAGQITLEVLRQGRWVVFRCHDDGRGVDVEAVRSALKGRGVAETESLTPREVLGYLVQSSLSTSADVTQVAGRGVGLDVAREAAQRLGGEVKLETGSGSTLELRVPVSLASLEALVVQAGPATALIPLENVAQALRLGPEAISHTPTGMSIIHAEQVVPVVELAPLLGVPQPAGGDNTSLVVMKARRGPVALSVERLRGTSNAVLRPLPPLARAHPVVAGAALDPLGNPQLVLDPEGVWEQARRAPAPRAAERAAPRLLVVDDSLTTRMLEQSILESAGYRVDLAASAEEGLELLQQTDYSLILIDVEMPGMDGFQMVEKLRQEGRAQPILMVSSLASQEHKDRARRAGAQGYIVKSEFDQRDLLDRIRKLIA